METGAKFLEMAKRWIYSIRQERLPDQLDRDWLTLSMHPDALRAWYPNANLAGLNVKLYFLDGSPPKGYVLQYDDPCGGFTIAISMAAQNRTRRWIHSHH